ncbi:uncharacterized protein LOC124674077 isoform X1 [Lolium rigidum]|uniref:uncharacterized protein LOC124674077 isoform X1 n=2 Tax=Lolium TaxID=4520 RepID=UPI001F5CEDA0|nr:uncharacterized protein LOC124674077 isoform X1 [Lolium rigidum]
MHPPARASPPPRPTRCDSAARTLLPGQFHRWRLLRGEAAMLHALLQDIAVPPGSSYVLMKESMHAQIVVLEHSPQPTLVAIRALRGVLDKSVEIAHAEVRRPLKHMPSASSSSGATLRQRQPCRCSSAMGVRASLRTTTVPLELSQLHKSSEERRQGGNGRDRAGGQDGFPNVHRGGLGAALQEIVNLATQSWRGSKAEWTPHSHAMAEFPVNRN